MSKVDLDKPTGIVEWSFSLKPKGDKDMIFKYEIKQDKDQNVPL